MVLSPHKRIREVSFDDSAKEFIKQKYNETSYTYHDIDWRLNSIQYKNVSAIGKVNVTRFTHHRLPSGNMMFKDKHQCPICGMILDLNTDHDRYLTYALAKQSKINRLISLTFKRGKLHTPPLLQDIIVNSVDQYYNNGLVDDLP